MTTNNLWQTKLHARLHDPAEKALVLLRDPAGHEGGSSKVLHRLLGFGRIDVANIDPDNAEALHGALFHNGIPKPIYEIVRRADWWAAAADRPQWPLQEIAVETRSGKQLTLKVAEGAQVRWTQRPVLIHPLTGKTFDLGSLGDTELQALKSRSFEHFSALVQRQPDGEVDWNRTLLAYWRFGPELRETQDNGTLGVLWPQLPADTRVPDHSIWDHLDLTSAFAGAFAADPEGEVALLTLALGPVQSFIAAARSTSDLWAGSHLLARLAWEAMKPVCEALGPDAILFPRLRGVPQVDLWLRDECRLPRELFDDAAWTTRGTDANPLFAAALPNRFVAIVPRAQVQDLVRQIERAVRGWLEGLGQQVVDRLLEQAGVARSEGEHAYQQMRQQLEGFPEVHWAAVPFSLIRPRNTERQTDLDTTALSAAMAPFFGVAPGEPAGFLASPAWQVLQKETAWEGNTTFFSPNPGALYPAVHDLAERALAAAKSVRTFAQGSQGGWRCSLTGETEWLTTDPQQLLLPPGQRRDTLWVRIARKRPAWARKGEHLGALPAIKRLWPTLFAQEVGRAVGDLDSAQRFVVSTHTMSLAHQLDRWLDDGGQATARLQDALARHGESMVALPRRLMRRHARNAAALADARRLPGLLDAADELDDETQAQELRRLVSDALGRDAGQLETYYGLLLMDGDRMGAWLAGGDDYAISYRDSFHPDVHKGFDAQARKEGRLRAYAEQRRAVSPNRHLSISAALNDFSLVVAPHVVEDEHLGRLIYAGGDDVLAMLPVADLLPAMQRLRVAYAGHDPAHEDGDYQGAGLKLKDGFALLRNRGRLCLMRMMGTRATASCGAVVAHHQAPLGAVMRELRAAESRAKGRGGRDAFSLTIVKRSGGALTVTAKWGEPVDLLHALRKFLGADGVSRRAVYNSLAWLRDLPQDQPAMLETLLAYQLARQADKAVREAHDVPRLAQRLAALAFDDALRPPPRDGEKRLDWLVHFMSAAEFLARATRNKD
ncbi:type III-B CRISPR-associated protein Cas10/Cmr2 [uncultured Azohydromonas sp.]|jgi:CRISPR-associated protein Cas10/Cmr2, subtype III-B|uniref:type III-B CRISPR-associated protein Cas10/Cmr2 n=1 Tax=uncultured Azohydromonas sp. TaxID=487342 RepID=UPI0026346A10|nr:type III-B CRISPR-associated protein Cas10/Cmr2 [uncultured Azohydromonas sp.]